MELEIYCFCCCKLYFINFILSENIILMTVSQFTLISIVELGRKMKKVGYKRQISNQFSKWHKKRAIWD